MAQIPAFGFLVVFTLFFMADAQTEEPQTAEPPRFEDVWTAELRESTRVCRGRLPIIMEGKDMEFMYGLSKTGAYIKYMDQPYYFRILEGLLSKQPVEARSLSDVRCLFESPCLTLRGYSGSSNVTTIDACTGSSVRLESKMFPDGCYEGVISGGNGKPVLSAVTVPAYTDRRSFVINISCFSDGNLGFAVFTNRPGLSAYTRHQIKDFLDKSGFADNFRISTAYMSSSCKNKIDSATVV